MAEHHIQDASTLSGWRKSSYSGSSGASCIEVIDGYAGGVPVRDSKNPQGPALVVSSAGWASFVAATVRGELGA